MAARLALLGQKAGALEGAVPPPLGTRQLLLKAGSVRRRLCGPLAQRGQLTLERGPLTFQRPSGSGRWTGAPAPAGGPCLAARRAGAGPASSASARPLSSCRMRSCSVAAALPMFRRRPPARSQPVDARCSIWARSSAGPEPPCRRVGQSLGRQRQVSIELAQLHPERGQAAGHLGPLRLPLRRGPGPTHRGEGRFR